MGGNSLGSFDEPPPEDPPARKPGWHEYLDLERRIRHLESLEDRRRRDHDRDTGLLEAAAFVIATAEVLGQLEEPTCPEQSPRP